LVSLAIAKASVRISERKRALVRGDDDGDCWSCSEEVEAAGCDCRARRKPGTNRGDEGKDEQPLFGGGSVMLEKDS